jgi:hypothetical protein
MITRSIEVGASTCFLGFDAGKSYIPTAVFDATTLEAGSGGTNEVQVVTITGTPAGGTFTLTFRGQTTGTIAYNAIASVVEDALEALSTVGEGDVKVTGGPGPGTPYTVTFINTLGVEDVPVMTASGAGLTGGTTPAVAVTTGTAGSATGFDPRITVGSFAYPGTIVTRVVGGGTGDDTIKEYTGSGSIYGIIDGIEEFFAISAEASRALPVYGKQAGLVVDARKVKNYVTHKTAFDTWAAANGVAVRYG